MTYEVKSPLPGPEWEAVHQAEGVVKSLRWLVAGGHLDQQDIADMVEKLKEVIEREITKL